MWTRNLLFLGLVCGGAAALSATLYPLTLSPRRVAPERSAVPVPAADPTVARVDAALREPWASQGLTPAPRAPELALMRRLSLALTGTIPSLQEIREFEARPEAGRLRGWLERTLADRRCTDYLAERLARAYVGTEDGPFLIFRRRRFVSWLSDQLMANRPYDQVVRELVAGKGLWTDHPSTNFLTVTYDNEKKAFDAERLGARVAQAFLGVRLDCAQCHDHPFQPWKQGQFRGLAAFFGQLENGFSGVHDTTAEYQPTNRKTGKPETIAPAVPFHPELLPADGPRRERLAKWLTDPANPHMPRATVNRLWALLFGRPLVDPVDDLASVADTPPALPILADDFAAHGFDLRRLIRLIAATEAFTRDEHTSATADPGDESWSSFPLTRLRPEQVAGAVLQAGSLETINARSHILVRLATLIGTNDFVRRYGDTGDDTFEGGAGTIPQRLLMMNGDLVHSKTKDDLINAPTRIAILAPTDAKAVDTAYLSILTRRPTAAEAAYFGSRLAGTRGQERKDRMTDLCWTLLNATEFSWNH